MPSLNSDLQIQISTDANTAGVDKAERAIDGLSGSATKNAAVLGAVAGVAQAVVARAMDAVSSSVTNAVKRVDTLNNANRTFENMGFSAKDTSKVMVELDKSIRGLPTSLDDAVSGVELLAGSTNDISKSKDIFAAINDAVLGFGGSAVGVNGAIVQLSQAFSNGKVDAQTWNSLIQNGMGPALNALARTMGITTGALKDGLSDGSISVQQFQDGLIQLDTKGGGGMKSLHKIAKDSTDGIGTGMDNAKTAVSRGMANIIQSIGSSNISKAISTIGKSFEELLKDIGAAVKGVKSFFDFLSQHQALIAIFGSGIAALATIIAVPLVFAFGAWAIAAASAAAATFAMAAPVFLIGAALGGLVYLVVNNWDTIKGAFASAWQFITGVFSGVGGWFADRFNQAWNSIRNAFAGIGGFFGDVWGRIKGVFSDVGHAVGDAMSGAFKGVVNGTLSVVANAVNGFINLINGALGAINKVPGVNIGKIGNVTVPHFETGVRNFEGGLAVVGDINGQGGEIIDLPQGANVHTNRESKKMLSEANGRDIKITQNIYNQVDYTRGIKEIGFRLATV